MVAVSLKNTDTYGEIARRLGEPDAARAVGHANARNTIAIIVTFAPFAVSGGIVALTGVLSVYFSQAANVSPNQLANGLGFPYYVAVVLALLGAVSIGALNAFFVVRLKVPSIIVTLGTMMVARGIAQVITQGAQRNTSLPDVFGVIGNMAVPGTTIKVSVVIMLVLVAIAFIFVKDSLLVVRKCLARASPLVRCHISSKR